MEDHERELAAAATEAAMKEDELELSLGLRPAAAEIRRNSSLSKPKSPVPEGSGDLSLRVPLWGKGSGAGSELDSEGLGLEIEAKREAQALRRQEARKKREEKRKLKASAVSGGDDSSKRRRKGAPTPAALQRWVNGGQLNGLPCYMMMPGLVGGDGRAVQAAAGGAGGFRPYVVADNVKQTVSGGSRGSSPGVSDHRNSSGQGGSSSEGGSHSSHSHPLEHTTGNGPTTSNGKAECDPSSYQMEPSLTPKTTPSPVKIATSSSNTESCHIARNSEVQTETSPGKKLLPAHTNEANGVKPSKPPKPPAQQSNEAMLLTQMPYVSTTGNVPNGKTITGFLYKYSQSEVCIVCVCHGRSLTPAGFVEHAGGVDIENPLRHITVVPFSLT